MLDSYFGQQQIYIAVGLSNYLILICRGKTTGLPSSLRDGHVIISSGCLILTAVKLIILVRMSYIIDRLVSRCARSIVTLYIGLHEVCLRVVGRTLRHNQIFLDG